MQHSTGGYLVHYRARHRLDLRPQARWPVFWCTADVGWVTSHTITYGPLALVGATEIVFGRAHTLPDASRFWKMIERHRVSIFTTAPTAIRSLIKAAGTNDAVHPLYSDLQPPARLGGATDQPSGLGWYRKTYVGGGRCPIVDLPSG